MDVLKGLYDYWLFKFILGIIIFSFVVMIIIYKKSTKDQN